MPGHTGSGSGFWNSRISCTHGGCRCGPGRCPWAELPDMHWGETGGTEVQGEDEGPLALSPCSAWELRGPRTTSVGAPVERAGAPRDKDGPLERKRLENLGKSWAITGAARRGPGRAQNDHLFPSADPARLPRGAPASTPPGPQGASSSSLGTAPSFHSLRMKPPKFEGIAWSYVLAAAGLRGTWPDSPFLANRA